MMMCTVCNRKTANWHIGYSVPACLTHGPPSYFSFAFAFAFRHSVFAWSIFLIPLSLLHISMRCYYYYYYYFSIYLFRALQLPFAFRGLLSPRLGSVAAIVEQRLVSEPTQQRCVNASSIRFGKFVIDGNKSSRFLCTLSGRREMAVGAGCEGTSFLHFATFSAIEVIMNQRKVTRPKSLWMNYILNAIISFAQRLMRAHTRHSRWFYSFSETKHTVSVWSGIKISDIPVIYGRYGIHDLCQHPLQLLHFAEHLAWATEGDNTPLQHVRIRLTIRNQSGRIVSV